MPNNQSSHREGPADQKTGGTLDALAERARSLSDALPDVNPSDIIPSNVTPPNVKLPRLTPGLVVLLVALLAVAIFALRLCTTAATIDVTVNGTAYTIHGAKTVQTAIHESGLPINPGDLISLRGTVLKPDEGHPFSATVNGVPTTDPDLQLHNGDVITLTDGEDIVEDYDAVQEPIPFGVDSHGVGPIRTFEDGKDGVLETRTGKLSGDVVEKKVVLPTDVMRQCTSPDVGDEKVVALTFDGGPNGEFTTEILDLLEENEISATFFCVPDEIGWEDGPDILRRARELGCEIGLYGYYDSTVRDAERMSTLNGDDQVAIIQDGKSELSAALGDSKDKQYLVRLPYGYIFYDIMLNLKPYISVEVGWDLDTGDWANYSSDSIYETLMQVEPGNIVRLHDGGGDRTETVSALKRAIPKLLREGYSFVTVSELMAK